MNKKLAWRCRNIQQQRDKAEIYNSPEWRKLRALKLQTQPLCEKCRADGIAAGVLPDGWIRSAHCVHHIVPIETASSKEEMKRIAFCGLDGLMSLCDECHRKIHTDAGYHKKAAVLQRREDRLQRWIAKQGRGRHVTQEACQDDSSNVKQS